MSIPTPTGEFKYYKMSFEERGRLLDELKKILEGVKGILFAYVYGSFIKKELFRDIDIAIWIKDNEDPFKYEVDLKVPVDIHVLNKAPITFKHVVFTEGKLLFSMDEKTRIEVVDETIRQYIDLCMLRSLGEDGK